MTASFSDNEKDHDRPNRWRYADIYAAINPADEALPPDIGITRTSAYSWLCRRRHNHDLRHTFGTRMIAKVDIRRVQDWMGHADIQTTMRYLHYAPREEEARLVAEAFAVDTTRDVLGRVGTSRDVLPGTGPGS